MLRILIALICLLSATEALAQDQYRLRVYNRGAASHFTEVESPAPPTVVTCNLDPATMPAAGVNPRFAYWDDALNTGRVCRWDLTSTFAAVPPIGSYDATLAQRVGTNWSAESNRAPFEKLSNPTNLRVRGGSD